MQKFSLLTATILIVFISCSKHQDPPLNPTDALLIGSPWALQRSDTIYYNSYKSQDTTVGYIDTVLSRQTYIPAGCSSQLHYVFYRGSVVQSYTGCSQPAFDPSAHKALSWQSGFSSTGQPFIAWDVSAGPPSGPVLTGGQDILTLTKDSLVLGIKVDSGSTPYLLNGILQNNAHRRYIKDSYTH